MKNIAKQLKQAGFNPYPASLKGKYGMNFLDGKPSYEAKKDNPAVVTWGDFRDRIISDEEIDTLFSTTTNICHVFNNCNEYNLVALDFDVKRIMKVGKDASIVSDPLLVTELQEYTASHLDKFGGCLLLTTPNQGIHVYVLLRRSDSLKIPKKFKVKNSPLGGDFLRKGMIAMLPPSVYDGKGYSWHSTSFESIRRFESLPELLNYFDIEFAGPDMNESQVVRTMAFPEDFDEQGRLKMIIDTELEKIRSCERGYQIFNNTLYEATCIITKYGINYMDESVIFDLIYPIAKEKAVNLDEHNEFTRTINSAIRSAKRHPKSVFHKKRENPSTEELEKYFNDRYNFRYNEINNQIEWKKIEDEKWKDLDDMDYNKICYGLDLEFGKFGEKRVSRLINGQLPKPYNAFKECFESFPAWDEETDYIKQVAETITVNPGQEEVWYLYLKRWMIAAVGCALEMYSDNGMRAINDNYLILHGDQGMLKSRWLNRLSFIQDSKYNFCGYFDVKDKDHRINLSRCAMINMDEIEVTSKKSEWGALKSLSTLSNQLLRMPYLHYNVSYPRRASFCGSMNPVEFLNDPTGNRRFLIITALKITMPPRDIIDCAWAQAHFLMLKGEKYWFDRDEIKQINENNSTYSKVIREEELLAENFDMPASEEDEGAVWLSTSAIFEMIQSLSLAKLNINNISSSFKSLGFPPSQRKQINGIRMKMWLVKIREDSKLNRKNNQNPNDYSEYDK